MQFYTAMFLGWFCKSNKSAHLTLTFDSKIDGRAQICALFVNFMLKFLLN